MDLKLSFMRTISMAATLHLAGCASTQVVQTGAVQEAPLCQSKDQPYSALILWGPVWRPNQKDVPLREIAALQGIEDFSAHAACYASTTIRRLPGERSAERPTEAQVHDIATGVTPAPDRIVVLTVHELGPVLQINGPVAALGGGTEVVLEAQVYDGKSARQIAKRGVHWTNGGSFVIKGVKTLPMDMRSALDALFGLPRNDG
jgi:hypothetical protein